MGLKPTIPAFLDPAYNISDFAVSVTFASAATGYDNATSEVLICNFINFPYNFYSELVFRFSSNGRLICGLVCDTIVEATGILQGLSEEIERIPWRKQS